MDYNDKVDRLTNSVDQLTAVKRAAILGGASYDPNAILQGVRDSEFGKPAEMGPEGWFKALSTWRVDPQANAYIKAVLGTSAATGQAIVPNRFVDAIVERAAQRNIYREIMNVQTGLGGTGVDIPYEVTAHQQALLQGAYGSNKDVRDLTLGTATATFYPIAEIIDIGNQLLRQSEGAAERLATRRLGKAFGLAEANFILNGTGSSQPLGILQAFLAYGDIAAYKYTLNSESRVAALGNGLAKFEGLGNTAESAAIVMNPTDFWEMATETLGTSGSGGWAFDPADGAASSGTPAAVWGVSCYRDINLPVGTALIGAFSEMDIYLGDEYRIDVSSEAGNRFDQNVTGFRAEEMFGFNAEPYVRTGQVIKVLGL